jgi:hypothetical protein
MHGSRDLADTSCQRGQGGFSIRGPLLPFMALAILFAVSSSHTFLATEANKHSGRNHARMSALTGRGTVRSRRGGAWGTSRIARRGSTGIAGDGAWTHGHAFVILV